MDTNETLTPLDERLIALTGTVEIVRGQPCRIANVTLVRRKDDTGVVWWEIVVTATPEPVSP